MSITSGTSLRTIHPMSTTSAPPTRQVGRLRKPRAAAHPPVAQQPGLQQVLVVAVCARMQARHFPARLDMLRSGTCGLPATRTPCKEAAHVAAVRLCRKRRAKALPMPSTGMSIRLGLLALPSRRRASRVCRHAGGSPGCGAEWWAPQRTDKGGSAWRAAGGADPPGRRRSRYWRWRPAGRSCGRTRSAAGPGPSTQRCM